MTRFVFTAFKAVMFAIIFVFVWDTGFFLFRTLNLHQRMLLLTGQMVDTVEANNYMPDSFWLGSELGGTDSNPKGTYAVIMQDIVNTMNSGDRFILGYSTNYSTNGSGFTGVQGIDNISTTVSTGRDDGISYFHPIMKSPGYYGDIMLVWMEVGVAAPTWGYEYDSNQVSLEKYASNKCVRLSYRYVVPCLHYVKQA